MRNISDYRKKLSLMGEFFANTTLTHTRLPQVIKYFCAFILQPSFFKPCSLTSAFVNAITCSKLHAC